MTADSAPGGVAVRAGPALALTGVTTSGIGVHTVIEANHEFASQLDLWLELPPQRRGGIWIHSSWAGTGVSTTAGRA